MVATNIVSLGKNIFGAHAGSTYQTYQLNAGCGRTVKVTERGGKIISAQSESGQEALWQRAQKMFPVMPSIVDVYHAFGRGAVSWDMANEGGGGWGAYAAPQKLYGNGVPFPDLTVGDFQSELFGDHQKTGVRLNSPTCMESQLALSREVWVNGDGWTYVSESVANQGTQPVEVAPWTIAKLPLPLEVVARGLSGAPDIFQHPAFGSELAPGVMTQLGDGAFRLALARASKQMFKLGINFLPGQPESVSVIFPNSGIALDFEILSGRGKEYPHNFRGEFFWCGDPNNYLELEGHGPMSGPVLPGRATNPLIFRFQVRDQAA